MVISRIAEVESAAVQLIPIAEALAQARAALKRSGSYFRNAIGRMMMRPSDALHVHREAVRRVVEAHRASNPRVFGSVARGDDAEGSDIDMLIDPTPDTTLFDIGAIRHELQRLLGVPVDVVTPKALPDGFRASVIADAVVV